MADGIASAATVMPASTSRRALGARYFGSSPVTGRIRVSSGSSAAGRNGDASPYAAVAVFPASPPAGGFGGSATGRGYGVTRRDAGSAGHLPCELDRAFLGEVLALDAAGDPVLLPEQDVPGEARRG